VSVNKIIKGDFLINVECKNDAHQGSSLKERLNRAHKATLAVINPADAFIEFCDENMFMVKTIRD
jgi:hypothetical protein